MRDQLWVFGYGSLIWDPGFTPAERVRAHAHGWHRSFCMQSIHYRGTPEAPGLVLALDRAEGLSCGGVAFAARAGEEEAVLADLRARELISDAYLEMWIEVELDDGRRCEAVTYVIDRDHVQYCDLTEDAQVEIIATACGKRGPNCDYLWNTVDHLRELGISDRSLETLAERVRLRRG